MLGLYGLCCFLTFWNLKGSSVHTGLVLPTLVFVLCFLLTQSLAMPYISNSTLVPHFLSAKNCPDMILKKRFWKSKILKNPLKKGEILQFERGVNSILIHYAFLTIFLKRMNFLLEGIFIGLLRGLFSKKSLSKTDFPFRFCNWNQDS